MAAEGGHQRFKACQAGVFGEMQAQAPQCCQSSQHAQPAVGVAAASKIQVTKVLQSPANCAGVSLPLPQIAFTSSIVTYVGWHTYTICSIGGTTGHLETVLWSNNLLHCSRDARAQGISKLSMSQHARQGKVRVSLA